MPSAEHDMVVEMFIQRPELAPRLLELATGVGVPSYATVRTVSADLSSSDRNAYGDVAVAVDRRAGEPMFGLAVEIQLGVDSSRELVWPVYLVVLRRRLERDTDLLVFCPDNLVQRYRRPIRWGVAAEHVVRPVVVGYSDIPPVTEIGVARRLPELAVLSAATHATDPEFGPAVLRALRSALDELPADRSRRYLDYVKIRIVERDDSAALVGGGAEEVLDMGFVFGRPLHEFDEYPKLVEAYRKLGWKRGLEQGREQGLEQGLERGLLQGIVTVLETRGFQVDDAARERLERCHDHAELERWLSRAKTVEAVEELFEPDLV